MDKTLQISELAAALALAQSKMKNPVFNRVNPDYASNYATLAAVRDEVIPKLAAEGLSVIQLLTASETGVACETVLLHSSGQFISSILELPVVKSNAQGVGSAATYARRYALMALAGVSGDDDDDGNAAVKLTMANKLTATATKKDPIIIEAIRACADMSELRRVWEGMSASDRRVYGAEKAEKKGMLEG